MADHPAIAVNTLWRNLEMLLARRLPPAWARILLGVSGGFGLYAPGQIAEFAWPEPGLPALLLSRSGIRIAEHGDDKDQSGLGVHLARGGAAVIAVDSFHLPYRPAFGRVHSGRTVIVGKGATEGSVEIEDPWPPKWRGSLPLRVLDAARRSRAPLDPVREPVFAGVPLRRRWWSVEAVTGPPAEPAAWFAARLADLWADSAYGGSAESRAALGFEALRAALGDAGHDARSPYLRASLILRSEISPRAYMLCLLRAAAACLGDGYLAVEASAYAVMLSRLGETRDLLITGGVKPRPIYARLIDEALAAAATAERSLFAVLEGYAAPPAMEARRA